MHLLALALTTLISSYMAQVKKFSLNSKEHRTFLHVLSLAPFSPVCNDSTGSPLNLHQFYNSITFRTFHSSQFACLHSALHDIISLAFWGCQSLICSPSLTSTLFGGCNFSVAVFYNLEFSDSSLLNVYQP